jgi:two-component system, cell cycle sensor histidine kinase and response regulator CckA
VTILLVEDEPHLRKIISSMLERKGYHVVTACNGAEALGICANHDGPIHLLLTDIEMPDLSGPDVAAKAVASRPSLQVLYMSGSSEDVLEEAGIQASAKNNFIQKPFDTNSLVAKVRKILGGDGEE